jgi:hypothetical protein
MFATRRSRSWEDPLTPLLKRVGQGQLAVVPLGPLFEGEGSTSLETKHQERSSMDGFTMIDKDE